MNPESLQALSENQCGMETKGHQKIRTDWRDVEREPMWDGNEVDAASLNESRIELSENQCGMETVVESSGRFREIG